MCGACNPAKFVFPKNVYDLNGVFVKSLCHPIIDDIQMPKTTTETQLYLPRGMLK